MKPTWQNILANKTAPITGVSSGIGREIAQLLAARSVRIFGTVHNPISATAISAVEIVRMAGFGVRAALIKPALTKTKIGHNEKTAQTAFKEYAVQRKRMSEEIQRGIENGDDPGVVAETVYQAVTAKSHRLRYPVGQGVTLSRLRRFAPAGMFDRSLRKQFHLD